MNEELSKAITELVGSVVDAKDFLVAELPEYVYQLLMWHGVYNFSMFVLGIVLTCVTVIVPYKLLTSKTFQESFENGEIEMPKEIAIFFIGFGQVVLLAISCSFFNLTWLQIWLAPKVWLVDYAMSLVK